MRSQHADEGEERQAGNALVERLAALETLLLSQQERLERQQAEIEHLRAALASGEPSGETPTGLILPTSVSGRAQRGIARQLTSRRSLLKVGGVAAAAGLAVAAGDMVARTPTARAAGTQWQTGTVNADTQTLVQQGGTWDNSDALLRLQLGSGSVSSPASLKAALAAYDTTSDNIGVYGSSSGGYGLFGATDTGAGATGAGLKGSAASSGTGVLGNSGSGIGVQGNSGSGIGGSFSGGLAPLALGLASAPGAPTSGTHVAGEIYADSAAGLWLCKQGGTPGTWAQVGTGQANYAGGVVNLLAAPIRLLDTRQGAPAGSANVLTGTPIPWNTTLQIPVAGVTFQGQTIPAGATAIIGNLTVSVPSGVTPGAGSSMKCYATGQAIPVAVNVSYNGPGSVGNLTLSAIGPDGTVTLYSRPINHVAVDAIFDAFGFVK